MEASESDKSAVAVAQEQVTAEVVQEPPEKGDYIN